MFDILAFIRFYPRSSSPFPTPFSFLLSSLHIRPQFGRLPDSYPRFLLSRLGGQNPRSFPAFCPAFLEIPFGPLLFLSGARNPRRQAFGSSVLEPRSFPATGWGSGSPPFFPPRRDPLAPAGSVLCSLGVCGRACCPYPHRLFSLSSCPGILFVLCFVKSCFPSVFDLSVSTGNISSLPLLRECRSGSESEQRPTDNMTTCYRPIFRSPDGQPARWGADAAGRLCRRNGMNGCPCDIEEKEKSHNDGYATFVPSCFSGLCFPLSLEMRISGSR